jgi:hypothetical protein
MSAPPFVRGVPLAVLAAAIPLVAPPVAAAAMTSDTTGSPSYCSTRQLTPEEMAAGVTSEIECYPTLEGSLAAVGVAVPEDTTMSQVLSGEAASGSIAAIHYKSSLGSGDYLSVQGDRCDGGGLNFAAGESWNDAIVSTRHRLCSQVKHYTDADYSGNIQSTNGQSGMLLQLNSLLARQVSAIRYFGTMNQ